MLLFSSSNKETFFVREALLCKDQMEHKFFNTGGVAGRAEFEYICSICGADPDETPLVSDAVLGIAPDGRKLLPICEDCHDRKLKPRSFGKADQPKAKAARRESRGIAKAAGRAIKDVQWCSLLWHPHSLMTPHDCVI